MSSRNDTRFYHVCGEVMLLQVGPRAFTACGTVALRVSRSASRTMAYVLRKLPRVQRSRPTLTRRALVRNARALPQKFVVYDQLTFPPCRARALTT